MNVKEEEFKVTTSDGLAIAATVFRPEKENGKAILMVPASGMKQTYYQNYFAFLARNGFTTVTFDYRGVGKSLAGNIRKFDAHMHDWGEKDLAGMLDWIKNNLACKKLFVVTNSVGGQILGLAENCGLIDGAVMIASAHGYYGNWKWPVNFIVKYFWGKFAPNVIRKKGYFTGKKFGLGDDLPPQIALEWAAWCLEPDFFFGIYPESVTGRYGKMRIPILSYSFDDDWLANDFRVDKLMAKYSGANITRRHVAAKKTVLKRIGHTGFFKKELEGTLWAETLEWLSDH